MSITAFESHVTFTHPPVGFARPPQGPIPQRPEPWCVGWPVAAPRHPQGVCHQGRHAL